MNIRDTLRIIGGILMLFQAASSQARSIEADKAAADDGVTSLWILRFAEPPVLSFDGEADKHGGWALAPTRPDPQSQKRFSATTQAVVAYQQHLDQRRLDYLQAIEESLDRRLQARFEYSLATYGVAVELTAKEADRLRGVPGVSQVIPDRHHLMHTDAGPGWIGAPAVWDGSAPGAGVGTLGEGVVIGVLDSGVNWDHPAFADIGGDGFDHDNPRSGQIGLCILAQVRCNDKLIGVHDFTEENSDGKDTDGHGTHVASTAMGNIRNERIQAVTTSFDVPVSGVAPHANLIMYKVCNSDDPDTVEDEGFCPLSAILAGLDQVVIDQPSVINYSIGSSGTDPWDAAQSPDSASMLNVRAAGTLIVASAGNSGPGPGTISSPANSPWVVATANIHHNRRFANSLEMMTGGNTTPPPDLDGVGVASGIGPRPIVHAADFGNALCGAGPAELQPTCEAHTGSTNPFPPGTFNGEIVVCDRGTYGRVEKGFNLRAAGAGGYVLANTDAQGESIVGDSHCLPALHLGDSDGDVLRAWVLDGGNNHSGVISGQTQQFDDALGDVLAGSSSRGPGAAVSGVLKPDLAAPGTDILAAGLQGSESAFKTGTSMASPHVTGLAALLVSSGLANSPAQLHSILVTSALNEGMLNSDGVSPAMARDVGAGRARADRAIGAGLFLNVTRDQFLQADPGSFGDPSQLNLPGLVNDACLENCQFTRTVTDLAGGGDWIARLEGVNEMVGSITPDSFSLADGGSQTLVIDLDVSAPQLVASRVEGSVVLENTGDGSELRLPFSVFADPGDLPADVTIVADSNRGTSFVSFGDVVALPDAAYQTLGLEPASVFQRSLPEDESNQDPYDDLNQGVFFRTVTVNNDGGLVFAETVPLNNGDLDLFVGLDLDGDGPEESEEICQSTSPDSVERCVIRNADAGNYWILVQNWQAQTVSDRTRIRYVAIQNRPANGLIATGPGQVDDSRADFDVRLIWDQGAMKSAERWYGALIPKASRDQGTGELGQVLVELRRRAVPGFDPADPELDRLPGYALSAGESALFALAAGEGHGRLFIDIPAGTENLTVTTTSMGEVDLFLIQEPARFESPDIARVSGLDSAVSQATGTGGNHQISLQGTPTLVPGRYYIVPVNTETDAEVRVTVEASVQSQGNTVVPTQGLWFNPARDGAGFNLNLSGDQLIIEWYTYLEDGTPTWYLAQGPFPQQGDTWQAELMHFNWNGEAAAGTAVGQAMLVFQSPTDLIFNFRVNGASGSEPYTTIISDLSCETNGDAVTRTGLWFLPALSGFGYSILSLGGADPQQVHINYLYDGLGFPRWVLGQGDVLANGSLTLSQFSGFCPACQAVPVSTVSAGSNTASFDDAMSGQIMTEVVFSGGVPGVWMQAGDWVNLTPTLICSP